jgi:hypothetical protein
LSTRFLEALYYSKPTDTAETTAGYYSGLINDEHCIVEHATSGQERYWKYSTEKISERNLKEAQKNTMLVFLGGHATLSKPLLLSVTAESSSIDLLENQWF